MECSQSFVLSTNGQLSGHYNRAALTVKAKSKILHQDKSFVLWKTTLVKTPFLLRKDNAHIHVGRGPPV